MLLTKCLGWCSRLCPKRCINPARTAAIDDQVRVVSCENPCGSIERCFAGEIGHRRPTLLRCNTLVTELLWEKD